MEFRAALPADAYALAELSIMAGDGMYDFLLEGLAPKAMLPGLLARSIKQEGGLSWHHCYVATDRIVVGMINAFPACWLQDEEKEVLPPDRVQILEPIDQAQDWNSFLVNGLAVRPTHRRQGIGKRLINWAIERASAEGFSRITANVWEDNQAARSTFEVQKFTLLQRIPVAKHPLLSHTGDSLLLVRDALTFR